LKLTFKRQINVISILKYRCFLDSYNQVLFACLPAGSLILKVTCAELDSVNGIDSFVGH